MIQKFLIWLQNKFPKIQYFEEPKYISNTKPSKKDSRDYLVTSNSFSLPLPDEYQIENIPPIKQQGSIGSCFPGATKILMEDFCLKNISDIKIGDKVFTHKGHTKRVIELFKRKWQGTMYRVSSMGHYEPIIASPEHPFLTKRGWIEAKNLTKKDYVFFPINLTVRDTHIYDVEKDTEFLWILGLYIAEGNITIVKNSYRICFSLHIKEEELANRIQKFFSKRGCTTKIDRLSDKKTLRVRVSDTFFGKLFLELGGNLCNFKKLHKRVMFFQPKLQLEIYKGWIAGDGSHKIFKNKVRGTTTSKELANQMQQILFRNNIFCSITTEKRDNKLQVYNVNVVLNSKDSYRRFTTEDGFFVKLISVEKIPQFYGEHIYNIGVEDDESYQVQFRAVHNCRSHSIIREYEIQLNTKKLSTGVFDGSELFHYYMTRKYVNNTFPKDTGMSMRDGCITALKFGVCAESLHPYNTQNMNKEPDKWAKGIADLFRIKRYEKLQTIEDIKLSILEQIPVGIGIFCDDEFMRYRRGIWNPQTKGNRGGHAVTVIGWNKNGFIIDNSWGRAWGMQGKFIMSYDAFTKFSFDWYRLIL